MKTELLFLGHAQLFSALQVAVGFVLISCGLGDVGLGLHQ